MMEPRGEVIERVRRAVGWIGTSLLGSMILAGCGSASREPLSNKPAVKHADVVSWAKIQSQAVGIYINYRSCSGGERGG